MYVVAVVVLLPFAVGIAGYVAITVEALLQADALFAAGYGGFGLLPQAVVLEVDYALFGFAGCIGDFGGLVGCVVFEGDAVAFGIGLFYRFVGLVVLIFFGSSIWIGDFNRVVGLVILGGGYLSTFVGVFDDVVGTIALIAGGKIAIDAFAQYAPVAVKYGDGFLACRIVYGDGVLFVYAVVFGVVDGYCSGFAGDFAYPCQFVFMFGCAGADYGTVRDNASGFAAAHDHSAGGYGQDVINFGDASIGIGTAGELAVVVVTIFPHVTHDVGNLG
ncbi:hypothetical protein SALWKB29_2166 [Snodgrassella communis]|uniref:Uncharacterized protein n=1 Tax=Snodgrassella communis TaxID=2946699 RepID=A0A836Z5B5_9NEIS|nr:hypothetical protein SALWKB29_2166 [Snodgrassella communis]